MIVEAIEVEPVVPLVDERVPVGSTDRHPWHPDSGSPSTWEAPGGVDFKQID